MALLKVCTHHKKKFLFCGVSMAKPDKMVMKMFTVRQNIYISPTCKTK